MQQHLNKCLYYVNIGNNDYLNNYFLPEHYPSNSNYTTEQYAIALAIEYSTYVKVFISSILEQLNQKSVAYRALVVKV